MKRESSFSDAIVMEVYEVLRTMRRHFGRRARTMGFTQGQWRVLWQLDRNEGISQAGLADILEMQPISLARVLERMESSGLIRREPDPEDRRALKLFLTPQAGPILKTLHTIGDEVRAIANKDLSRDEQTQLASLLRRMRSNFDASDVDVPPRRC